MKWKNNSTQFGLVAIVFHWLVAITVFCLFTLGWWMTQLDYYDSWYKLAPWWHKSIGILLFLVLLTRLAWRKFSPPPLALTTHKHWEVRLAHSIHLILYTLLFVTMISGYLISTADSRDIEVFNWFVIPATMTSIPKQEDISGTIHLIVASSLIALALLHALAAIKHHFIDQDNTLKRIIGL